MSRDQDDRGIRVEPEQGDANQRAGLEIERCARLDHADAVALAEAIFGTELAEIYFREPDRRRLADALDQPPVNLVEDAPEDLVPLQDAIPRVLDQLPRDAALEAPANRDVVGGIAGAEPVEQPESLLADRARELAGSLDAVVRHLPRRGLLDRRLEVTAHARIGSGRRLGRYVGHLGTGLLGTPRPLELRKAG